VPSDSPYGRRSNKDVLHYSIWRILFTTMPFKLKSAGATNQRGIQRCQQSQTGRNVEAYIDDVVIKTHKKERLISNLAETFDNLSKFKMKLNPKKCMFGVPLEKLLEYIVSRRGIDVITRDKKDVTKKEIVRLLDVNSIIKYTTRIGSPILFLYLKRIKI
jgi:hypothetical protein